jgi:hypothetical protein
MLERTDGIEGLYSREVLIGFESSLAIKRSRKHGFVGKAGHDSPAFKRSSKEGI